MDTSSFTDCPTPETPPATAGTSEIEALPPPVAPDEPAPPRQLCIRRAQATLRHSAGWRVKIRRRRKDFRAIFFDSDYDGPEGSLAAAIHCRDRYFESHPLVSSVEASQRLTRNNTSGIVGVFRRRKRVRRGRRIHYYDVWTAVGTPEPNNRHTRDFYVKLHGSDENARDLAVAQRLAWVEALRLYEAEHGITRRRQLDRHEKRPLVPFDQP